MDYEYKKIRLNLYFNPENKTDAEIYNKLMSFSSSQARNVKIKEALCNFFLSDEQIFSKEERDVSDIEYRLGNIEKMLSSILKQNNDIEVSQNSYNKRTSKDAEPNDSSISDDILDYIDSLQGL